MQKWKTSDFNSNKDRLKEFAQSWCRLTVDEKQQYKDLLDREWKQYKRDIEEFKKVSFCCMVRNCTAGLC